MPSILGISSAIHSNGIIMSLGHSKMSSKPKPTSSEGEVGGDLGDCEFLLFWLKVSSL